MITRERLEELARIHHVTLEFDGSGKLKAVIAIPGHAESRVFPFIEAIREREED